MGEKVKMRTMIDENDRTAPDNARHRRPVPGGGPMAGVLALQQSAGNRAVSAYLAAGAQRTVQRSWGSSSSSSQAEEEEQQEGGDENIRDAGAIAGVE